jgi:acylphosphatase
MVQYKIRITGRVKGVGFRYFTQKRATELNITGWVKNTPGGVLIMAQGKKSDMQTFLDYLSIGPQLSRIENIEHYKMPRLESFDGFMIKY